jgi:predicted component of type VI protein secretion system
MAGSKVSRKSDPESDVELYTSPWVSGTRAAAYFGPISSELFLEDASVEDRSAAWTKAERELLESLRDKARGLGANAVVGLEVTLDPFAQSTNSSEGTGLRLHAVGTAAKLEPLF